jgi:hypothetical protein
LDLYVEPIQTSVARIPSIIVENGIGQPTIQVVTSNLDHLANVETLLSFSCIVPLLSNLKNLIKLAQAQDILVIDLVQTIKLT